MSDLVERLRERADDPVDHWEDWAQRASTAMHEAAAELSRLSALVAEWQKAAEPFVRVADFIPDPRLINTEYPGVMESAAPSVRNAIGKLTLGDFRRLSQLKDATNADK